MLKMWNYFLLQKNGLNLMLNVIFRGQNIVLPTEQKLLKLECSFLSAEMKKARIGSCIAKAFFSMLKVCFLPLQMMLYYPELTLFQCKSWIIVFSLFNSIQLLGLSTPVSPLNFLNTCSITLLNYFFYFGIKKWVIWTCIYVCSYISWSGKLFV